MALRISADAWSRRREERRHREGRRHREPRREIRFAERCSVARARAERYNAADSCGEPDSWAAIGSLAAAAPLAD